MTESARTRLRDGSSVLIRPLGPGDKDLLRSGFRRLSVQSRYRRFQSPLTELSEKQLSYLTTVDHHDHEALVALDPAGENAIGVARFARVSDAVAECAIVVADDWQNRGVATQLLDRLVDRARDEGIERFIALVLAENTEALRLLERLGETVRHGSGSQIELEIQLPERQQSTEKLRLLLAGVARGLIVPAISMWRQVADFAHRRRRRDAVTEPANAIVVHAVGVGAEMPALDAAAALAAVRRAHVHVVDSYWPMVSDRAQVDKRLAEAAGELRRRGIGATPHLLGGDAVDALIDVAEETEAALIVIDPHAPVATALLRAYSLPARVCARAPCDVLIAREAA